MHSRISKKFLAMFQQGFLSLILRKLRFTEVGNVHNSIKIAGSFSLICAPPTALVAPTNLEITCLPDQTSG